MNCPCSDGLHALQKENGREFAPADFVGDVLWRLIDTHCPQRLAERLVADIAALQLSFQEAFGLMGPVSFGFHQAL